MALGFRKLGILGAVVLAVTTLTPGTAAADSWWENPNTCTNLNTARSLVIDERRTIEVRYGWCNGIQYGWGRLLGHLTDSMDLVIFQVDLNGDRVADLEDVWLATSRYYTRGYPASASWQRAFRSCYANGSGIKGCTGWW